MTEADRIMQERARQRKAREDAARARGEQAGAERQAWLRREIKRLVPEVLRLLKEQGYPGAQEIQERKDPRFGRTTFKVKAAWPLYTYTTWERDGDVPHHVMLLSDGRIVTPTGWFTARARCTPLIVMGGARVCMTP